MIETYTQLHEMGYAHSFEIWDGSELVGGLYGISLGHAFFGESMFHTITDASKVALHFLCGIMQSWNFDFIDCQLPTLHFNAPWRKNNKSKRISSYVTRNFKIP